MTDYISRADAIEAICGTCSDEYTYDKEHYKNCNCYKDGKCPDIEALEALPSADAEQEAVPTVVRVTMSDGSQYYLEHERDAIQADAVQGWIPCSERLPSESGDYLCTIPLDADETYTEVLTFHKGRFYEDNDEWGATFRDDVLAWMPLPNPYKGGEDK